MNNEKNPLAAFLLGFIPGVGLMYLNRKRGILYLLLTFLLFFSFAGFAITNNLPRDAFFLLAFLGFVVWGINMLDTVITALAHSRSQSPQSKPLFPAQSYTHADPDSSLDPQSPFETHSYSHSHQSNGTSSQNSSSDRFTTILLSMIPGLGHLYLGLMQRGLVFLVGMFGLAAMVIFISVISRKEGFLAFLIVLPAIWLFSLFDVIQLLRKKQNGERLEDRTIFEDLERNRVEGKKSKLAATLLALFPGAGHMYLGLQKRGLQLMAAFLLSIYVLDVLRLTIFLFLIPLIWFYSFFDALQQVSKHGSEEVADVPYVKWFMNHQRWVGIALFVLGCYYLLDRMVMPSLMKTEFGTILYYWYRNYLQIFIVSMLLIGGGIRLIFGSKKQKERS